MGNKEQGDAAGEATSRRELVLHSLGTCSVVEEAEDEVDVEVVEEYHSATGVRVGDTLPPIVQ